MFTTQTLQQLLLLTKSELVDVMAADLRRYDAIGCESDAMRCLLGRRYLSGDIVMCLDEALFKARQAEVSGILAAS